MASKICIIFKFSILVILRMHERDILDGIEEILDEKGKFSPELDHETIRNGNRKLQRVKENVFRKQVKEIWGKHGPRLMAQIRAVKASADVGANMNGILQNQYRNTPKTYVLRIST